MNTNVKKLVAIASVALAVTLVGSVFSLVIATAEQTTLAITSLSPGTIRGFDPKPEPPGTPIFTLLPTV